MNNYFVTFSGMPYQCRESGDAAAFRSAVEFIVAQAGFEPHGWVGIDEAVNDDRIVRRFVFGGSAGFDEAKKVVTDWFGVFGGLKLMNMGGTSAEGLMRLDTF